jgi:hypothetical protein
MLFTEYHYGHKLETFRTRKNIKIFPVIISVKVEQKSKHSLINNILYKVHNFLMQFNVIKYLKSRHNCVSHYQLKKITWLNK